ncbi:MAG: hypothetical protein ACLP9L_10700, partial [Thermoguttaceae bacterium]
SIDLTDSRLESSGSTIARRSTLVISGDLYDAKVGDGMNRGISVGQCGTPTEAPNGAEPIVQPIYYFKTS